MREDPAAGIVAFFNWSRRQPRDLYHYSKRDPASLAEAGSKAWKLLTLMPCQPIPEAAADLYASIKISQQRRGLPLDQNDLWTAATVLAFKQFLSAVTATSKESKGLWSWWHGHDTHRLLSGAKYRVDIPGVTELPQVRTQPP